MDFKIVWTLRARQDLRDVATFIAEDNPPAALKLGGLNFTRVNSLETFPELGRVVPNYDRSKLREIIVKSYRIIYRVRTTEKVVEILGFGMEHAANRNSDASFPRGAECTEAVRVANDAD